MRWAALTLLAAMLLLAPAGDPNTQFRTEALMGPSLQHLFGTDALGHDLWTRFIHGGRWSFAIGLAGTALSLLLAWAVGSVAGWRGGLVDSFLMGWADVMLGLPWLYLLIALRAILPVNASPADVAAAMMLAMSVAGWARPARLVRGVVLSQRERGWVEAAFGFGSPPGAIYFRHVFPAVKEVLATQAVLLLPRFVLAELTLSFAGAGAANGVASWGALVVPLKQAYLLAGHWWLALPAVAIAAWLVSFSLLARSLALKSS